MSDVSFSRAAGAYNDALRAAQGILDRVKVDGAAESESSNAAKGNSFFDMVSTSLQSAANMGRTSETVAMNALKGKADLTDVVTAVSDAENALTSVIAIRDRVINAYQDIIKMPI